MHKASCTNDKQVKEAAALTGQAARGSRNEPDVGVACLAMKHFGDEGVFGKLQGVRGGQRALNARLASAAIRDSYYVKTRE